MKTQMMNLTPRFDARRMVNEYDSNSTRRRTRTGQQLPR